MRRPAGLLLLASVVLAGVPGAVAADQTLLGAWEITGGVMAPWVSKQSDEEKQEMATLKGQTITFKAHEIIAKSVLGCTEAGYEVTHYPAEALFQGSLPEGRQAEVAASLGLPAGEVPGMDVACSTGLFSYHFKDAATAMFALDNVIYTLKRK